MYAGVLAGAAEPPAALTADLRPGLCVVLDPPDGVAALRRTDLVHVLHSDAARVPDLRQAIARAGAATRASAESWDGKSLPHASNLANLLLAEDWPALRDKGLSLAEAYRVVAPYGTALVRGLSQEDAQRELAAADPPPKLHAADGWLRIDKPFPPAMDEWTQYAHDAASTFVSRDRIAGPPESLRWIAGDSWYTLRYSSPHVISAGGRVFFLSGDRGYKGFVECRDGFNGLLLWRTAPDAGIRDFVTDGERLFVLTDKLNAWDAATGKPLFELPAPPTIWPGLRVDPATSTVVLACSNKMWVKVFDSTTGKELWQADSLVHGWRGSPNPFGVVGDGKLYLMCQKPPAEGQAKADTFVQIRDLRSGKELGRIPCPLDAGAPGAVAMLDGKLILTTTSKAQGADALTQLYVMDPAANRLLWKAAVDGARTRYGGPLFMSGLFWVVQREGNKLVLAGLDPNTGEVRKTCKPQNLHTGCDMLIGLDRYVVGARMHLLDTADGTVHQRTFSRTPCRDSVRIANGLIYYPRHTCPCSNQMTGNLAASSERSLPEGFVLPSDGSTRLEKGPAYARQPDRPAGERAPWPTYRASPARGATTARPITPRLAVAFQTPVGQGLTAPTIAGGMVLVAAADEHRVVAIDAGTGAQRWSYIAGGIVDSPPTYHEGLVLFGCRDGWVYCLAADDGALAWRFRAAPAERCIVVHEQVESAWRVFGSVLCEQGLVYASAGRHADIDGGLWICALEPASGRLVWQRNITNPGHQFESAISSTIRGAAAINDVLRSDGRHVYLASSFQKVAMDLKTGEIVPSPEQLEMRQMAAMYEKGDGAVKVEDRPDDGDGAPVHRFEGPGVLRQWLALGPFDGDLAADRLAAIDGEAAARLTPKTRIPTTSPAKPDLSPQPLASDAYGINKPQVGREPGAKVAYLFCWVRSDRERTVRAVVLHRGGRTLWVNGQLAREYPLGPPFSHPLDKFPLTLKPGLNSILLKIEVGGRWSLQMALTDEPAMPILSTSLDMLAPPARRAMTGGWGDPTNSSAVWVYSPDPARFGMNWTKADRFSLALHSGWAADALAFHGQRGFGVGREQDAKRTAVAVFGHPSAGVKPWLVETGEAINRQRGLIVAGDVVVAAFGGVSPSKDAAPGRLRLLSASNGARLGDIPLDQPPRWDGLATDGEMLVVCSEDGKVIALRPDERR